MTPREWDAETYDRVSTPIAALGHEVLDRLELAGDETVLDAGCGSGRVTEVLARRLPRGRVIAVDGSAAMVEETLRRVPAADGRVEDLAAFDLGEQVDHCLSTATFHWIADHDALFACLRRAIRPGGRLVAQCGGQGNIAGAKRAIDSVAAREPYAAHVAGFDPWHFAGPAETEARLRAAGFREVRCWLEERPVRPPEPVHYFATIMLGGHAERMPAELHEPFAREVVAALGDDPVIDYVRLNIDAA